MPVLDVGRQLLWSRVFECFGESPYVVSILGEAYVKGNQGNGDLSQKDNSAVCLKHFIGKYLFFKEYLKKKTNKLKVNNF